MAKSEIAPIFCPQTNNYCFRAITVKNEFTPCAIVPNSFSQHCTIAKESLLLWKEDKNINQETSFRTISQESLALVNESDPQKGVLATLKRGEVFDQRKQKR